MQGTSRWQSRTVRVCIYSWDRVPMIIVELPKGIVDSLVVAGFTEIHVDGALVRIMAAELLVMDGELEGNPQLIVSQQDRECKFDTMDPKQLASVICASVHDRYPHEIRTSRPMTYSGRMLF